MPTLMRKPLRSLLRNAGLFAALFSSLLLMSCGQSDAPATAPQNVTVTPGDGRVVVSWTQEPGLEYWIFMAAADSITRDDYKSKPLANIVKSANSPQIVSGLANGVTYSFIVNSTQNGSPAGPSSASISALPRSAGFAWTTGAPLNGTNNLNGFAFGVNRYLAVTGAGGLYISNLGVDWSAISSGVTDDLNAIAFNQTAGVKRFVAVGNNGVITTSAVNDPTKWAAVTSGVTNRLNGVIAHNGNFVAVGDNGTILFSTDSQKWTTQTSNTTQNLYAVYSFTGMTSTNTLASSTTLVAVGAGGTILTSSDGTSWTARTSNTAEDLHGVTFGDPDNNSTTVNNIYTIVGNAGTILTSTDVVNWTAVTPITTANLNSVTYSTRFVAVGAQGTIVSGDGTSFSLVASGTSNDLFNIYFGLGSYLAGGLNGTRLYSM